MDKALTQLQLGVDAAIVCSQKKNSPIISSIICHRRMWDWVWMDNILAGYKKFEFSDTSLRSIISVIIFVWMPEETC